MNMISVCTKTIAQKSGLWQSDNFAPETTRRPVIYSRLHHFLGCPEVFQADFDCKSLVCERTLTNSLLLSPLFTTLSWIYIQIFLQLWNYQTAPCMEQLIVFFIWTMREDRAGKSYTLDTCRLWSSHSPSSRLSSRRVKRAFGPKWQLAQETDFWQKNRQ